MDYRAGPHFPLLCTLLRCTVPQPTPFRIGTLAIQLSAQTLDGKCRKDGGTVNIKIPPSYKDQVVPLLASLENIEIHPDSPAKVVIDERNGTVVMGANVRLATVAIAAGNLMVQIKEKKLVSQPMPFGQGTTAVVPDTSITVQEGDKRLMVLPEGVSIGQVVQALNAIGVTPRDLINILQAIKAAGALQAELEII